MIRKLFGGIKMTWPKVIIFALAAGVFTAAMAIWVPDGNSFHEIAVQLEAWILFALIIVTNCETPFEAALKTFVFFLISQPLVYLLQVPFSWMGFGLFQYYKYWFMITILTLPGAFIAWFVKRNDVIAGIILSVALALLIYLGIGYAIDLYKHFPNHLVSTIFCFGLVPFLIYGIFTRKPAILTSAGISAAALILMLLVSFGIIDIPFINGSDAPFAKSDYIELDQDTYDVDTDWEVVSENEDISTAWLSDDGEGKISLYISFRSREPNIITLKGGDGTEYRFRVYLDEDYNMVYKAE
ncbi:MAG: hypothetical protein IJM62_00140 [Lachnospiraceae bacterium]|nr:hypothetical protein [Lachnospiraceae bacterium]